MPSVRVTRFAGLLPEVSPKLLQEDHAQIAHNCLLWDGWLRPLPNWQVEANAAGTIKSIYPVPAFPEQYDYSVVLNSAQLAPTEPFVVGSLWGIWNDGTLRYFPNFQSQSGTPFKILEQPVASGTYTITPQHKSTSPIQRTYAITYLSQHMESAPTVLFTVGIGGTLFEGDIVTLNWAVTNLANQTAISGVRLYRTVTGFDTGESIDNPRETAFHLVQELFVRASPTFIYVDDASSDMIPGDRCLTEQFGPMLVDTPKVVVQTESGWLVVAGLDTSYENRSTIHVSDKFLWHAFALQNFNSIPEVITDGAAFYDDVFIGTYQRPYHIRIAHNEDPSSESLNIHVQPFPDTYACIPGTMAATNFGAMYASPDGLIALEVNEDQVASKKVANPGDIINNPVAPITFADTLNTAWWNGLFIGFCAGVGYVFMHENSHNNQYPLSQLVTFNPPPGVQGPSFVTGKDSGGLLAAFGNVLYRWPMPGYGYDTASMQIYRWKSKKFVMAGGTTFAAAKVVNSSDGALQFNFYGDGVLIYSVSVFDSQPFRIVAQHNVITVEVEVIGTATVQEIHLATSMRELTETTGTDYA